MMSEDEFIVFILSAFFTAVFLMKWYKFILHFRSFKHCELSLFTLGILPLASLAIIFFTLKLFASYDVVSSDLYITFYILLGFVWISFSEYSMFRFFDISWIDDALHMRNKAALTAIVGMFLGTTIIYAGANIGDGPGWWCVIFAGGIGLVTWILLGVGICRANEMSERITVERDLGCGIRFGSYMLASGIIIGRASGGDWTSFYMTIVEFYDVYDRWPVFLLAGIEGVVEYFYLHRTKTGVGRGTEPVPAQSSVLISVFWGALYIIFAIVSVFQFLPSLPQNPFYGEIWQTASQLMLL